MHAAIAAASLALGVSGAVLPRQSGCCFPLTASGRVSGKLTQLSDGQNRIGGNNGAPAEYCISIDGGITDGSGRGCILTPPTTQFQCDAGAVAAPGFAVNGDGQLQYLTNTTFYACPAAKGEYNVYTTPVPGQDKCTPITLRSGGQCKNTGADQQGSVSGSGGNGNGNGNGKGKGKGKGMGNGKDNGKSNACPANLQGPYQYPHLIVPISKESPDQSYGTSYFGQANSTMSSVFNFDIPQSYAGKTCSIVFLFPNKEDLETSSYDFSGSGSMVFDKLSSAASEQTTYNNCPKASSHLNEMAMMPGNSYVVATESCMAGQKESILMSAMGDMALKFFEDYNPSPLGMYITSC